MKTLPPAPKLKPVADSAPEVIAPVFGRLVPAIAAACRDMLAANRDARTIFTCARKFSHARFTEQLAPLLRA